MLNSYSIPELITLVANIWSFAWSKKKKKQNRRLRAENLSVNLKVTRKRKDL